MRPEVLGAHPDLRDIEAAEPETALTKLGSEATAGGVDVMYYSMHERCPQKALTTIAGAMTCDCSQPWTEHPRVETILLMIPQKAIPSSPNDFRPMCLIPGFSKLLDRLLVSRIDDDMRSQWPAPTIGFGWDAKRRKRTPLSIWRLPTGENTEGI